jgi:hypothetical protein
MVELLAALSLGTDLGMGHPMEHVLRQTYLALRLAEELGLNADDREVVYFSSMMAWVGCHIDAYELQGLDPGRVGAAAEPLERRRSERI